MTPSGPPKAPHTSEVNRRHFLLGCAAVGMTVSLTACSGERQHKEDPLYELLNSARRDVAAARKMSMTNADAKEVVVARQAHCDALLAEIKRQEKMWQKPQDFAEPVVPSSLSLRQLRTLLSTSAEEALTIVSTTVGYRAGLAGSIAASCLTLETVVLA